jgi:hypothetical protein
VELFSRTARGYEDNENKAAISATLHKRSNPTDWLFDKNDIGGLCTLNAEH